MSDQIHYIKPTFAGGEYAPSMYSRVDVSRYSSGAKKMYNFIVHPHGGCSNRPGWHYAATAKYSNRKCRMHDFQFSSTQTYALEIGHQYVRFYTSNSQIAINSATAWGTSTAYVIGNFVSQGGVIYYCIVNHTSGTFATDLAAGKWLAQNIYEVPMPYAESELPALNFTQSADVLFMFHPLYQPRQLNRLGATNWTVTLYDFQFGPFQVPNSTTSFTLTPSATTGSGTLTASSALFASGHVGGLFQVNHNVPEASVSSSLGSATNGSSITCGGTWRIITHGTWAATIAVQKSTDGGSTWANIRSFSSASDFNANTFGTEDMSNNAPNFLVRLNCSAYTSGTISYTLTADAFRNVGVVKITSYSSATSVGYTVTKTLGGTTATSDWAEGSWSDYRGWPAVGEFNQDRLVTGNTPNEPQTVWQTKASNYYDYSRSSPLVDSDGITTNLPSRQLNGINGFVPLTQLIALTSASEWGIATTNGVMSPLTITEKVYGYNGSVGIKPSIIKNRAIYVQFMGAVILDLGYELLSDTFTGSDLSILANHLFDGYSITDMCYQQYPDSLVWCVRNDGDLLSLTYLREQEVIAWAHHETNGNVESCCSIPVSGYNQVWLSTLRGDKRFIEYMDHRMASTLPEDQFFVDCGISYDGSLPDTYVKLYLNFDGIEGSQTFTDGEITPKTVTANNSVYITTTTEKFGTGSGWFNGDAGVDGFTKLLLHFDGTDGSTTILDSENTPKSMTAHNGLILSTTQSKFGGSAGYFNSGIDNYTVLMLHLDNAATDSSALANTMTNSSVAFTNSIAKFGYSGTFTGAEFIHTPENAAFNLGASDFTIDFWIYFNSAPSATNANIIGQGTNVANQWSLYFTSATSIRFEVDAGGPAVTVQTITWSPTLSMWYHVALVRSGSTMLFFINGVSQTVTSVSPLGTIASYTGDIYFGSSPINTASVKANIDEMRFSVGIARWTSNFQVPLIAYSATDYVSTPDSADFAFGTGDFTVDFWVKRGESVGRLQYMCGQAASDASDKGFHMLLDATGKLKSVCKADGSLYAISSGVISDFNWHHVAFVRYGNTGTNYIDGVADGTCDLTGITLPDSGQIWSVGTIGAYVTNGGFNGFIDEFRASKGYARWTANFALPTGTYGTPGYLSLANTADFDFGSGDFTIDFWLNPIRNKTAMFFQKYADANNYFNIYSVDGTDISFEAKTSSTLIASYKATGVSPIVGSWTHVAIVRYGTTLNIYINGIAQSLTVTQAISSTAIGAITATSYIGQNTASGNYFLNGYLDEFKIAKGVARYTANFTPPAIPGFLLSSRIITGLDYLNGKLVSILADGAVQAQQTVSGGQITLAAPASKVHVGLPYTSDLETLNIEAPLPDGTMQGRKLRVSKVTIRVLNSKGGYIGPDEDHLKLIKSNFADYSTTTALYTGDLKHSLGGGYADGGRMFIRQTDPLPITVLALMPLVSVAGMSMESA